MKKSKYEAPRIRYLDDKKLVSVESDLLQFGFFSKEEVIEFDYYKVDECKFEKTIFRNKVFYRIEFVDTVFEGCDFSGIEFESCLFRRVQFVNCKLLGASFLKCHLMHTEFCGCLMKMGLWSNSKLEMIKLTDNNMDESRCFDVELKKIAMDCLSLIKVEFIDTSLKGIDVSKCEVAGWLVAPRDLVGIKVSASQAIMFAQILGIEVTD